MSEPHRNVVVAVDLSPSSRRALAHAVSTLSSHATLHVLHVVEALVVEDLAEALRVPREQVADQVRGDARRDIERLLPGGVDVRIDVQVGSPFARIRDKVAEVDADLLVMGVYGASGQGPGAGTLATRCVRRLDRDVLLVDRQEPFRRILVGTDFSPTARRALRRAAEIAEREGAELHLVHAYHGPWNQLHYRAPTSAASPDYRAQYTRLLRSRLDVEASAVSVPVTVALIEAPSYGRAVAERAEKVQADLVVVGTRGRTNLRDVLLGSTAERVLRAAGCSILAVRAAP